METTNKNGGRRYGYYSQLYFATAVLCLSGYSYGWTGVTTLLSQQSYIVAPNGDSDLSFDAALKSSTYCTIGSEVIVGILSYWIGLMSVSSVLRISAALFFFGFYLVGVASKMDHTNVIFHLGTEGLTPSHLVLYFGACLLGMGLSSAFLRAYQTAMGNYPQRHSLCAAALAVGHGMGALFFNIVFGTFINLYSTLPSIVPDPVPGSDIPSYIVKADDVKLPALPFDLEPGYYDVRNINTGIQRCMLSLGLVYASLLIALSFVMVDKVDEEKKDEEKKLKTSSRYSGDNFEELVEDSEALEESLVYFERLTVFSLLRSLKFWLIFVMSVFTSVVTLGISQLTKPMFSQMFQPQFPNIITAKWLDVVCSMVPLAGVVGRLITCYIMERKGLPRTNRIIAFLALGLFALVPTVVKQTHASKSPVMLYLCMGYLYCAIGAAFGALVLTVPYIALLFGNKNISVVYGTRDILGGLISSQAPQIWMILAKFLGSEKLPDYPDAFYMAAVFYIIFVIVDYKLQVEVRKSSRDVKDLQTNQAGKGYRNKGAGTNEVMMYKEDI